MQRLIYVPPGYEYSDGVVLGAEEPFVLSSVKGLGGVETSVMSSVVAGCPGNFYQGSRKEPRLVPCTLYVSGSGRRDMYRQRCRLIGMLAPTDQLGTLYYKNDYISVKIPAVAQTPPDFTERIKNYNKADIMFWCPSPDWISLKTKRETVGYVENTGFAFPFEFPISFAMLKNEISIDYQGTSPAPVIITITGPSKNPSLTNTKTNEKIALSGKSLQANEQLIINTERGHKSVKLSRNGIIMDAFQYIDPISSFWSLVPGKNRIVYTNDEDSALTNMEIVYSERYAGV